MDVCLVLVMLNKYIFIFEIEARDLKTGRLLPHEYRKRSQMTISDARAYVRRLSNMDNIVCVRFYKQMF